MTERKARTPDDGAIIPPKPIENNLQTEAIVENVSGKKFDEPTIRTEIKNRFARLKKSLRRRSVSIL